MIANSIFGLEERIFDICIVGTGPVGISLAIELSRKGRSVLLLESGGRKASPEAQRLSDAEIIDPAHHVPMDIAVQRSLGGTSNLWGGRCVPLQPLDFERRAAVSNSGWPISYDELARHYARACELVGCGDGGFEAHGDRPDGDTPGDSQDIRFDRLERWAREPRFARSYARALEENSRIDLRLNATVVDLAISDDGQVSHVWVCGPDGTRTAIAARHVVLAAGALESTRLLLVAQRSHPQRFGGTDGALGRYYMGHLYGIGAEMRLSSATSAPGIDYFQDGNGYYLRRRFTVGVCQQERLGLTNVCFWPDYPAINDARHRDPILSLAYLALSLPPLGRKLVTESVRRHYVGDTPRRAPHLANLLRGLPEAATFAPLFFYRRYISRFRKPGFFRCNEGRRYSIRFHAEHIPNPLSRVELSDRTDAMGTPRLTVNLRYSQSDADPLVRAIDHLSNWFERTGHGVLTWTVPPSERTNYILSQCYDGHHQIGTTRMGASERSAVVDTNCRVFGTKNLFVAGSAVFPTSGKANPTLTAVAIGLRLAEHLATLTAAPLALKRPAEATAAKRQPVMAPQARL